MRALRAEALVRVVDVESGEVYAFERAEEEESELGGVRGRLRARVREDADEDATTFRVHAAATVELDGAHSVERTYYGLEHARTGLMLQRRRRGLDKLTFCSEKFGVNEQFEAQAIDCGGVRLINRRCVGAFDVFVEPVGTAPSRSGSASDENLTRTRSGDVSTAVDEGFDRMTRLVRGYRVSANEKTHVYDVLVRKLVDQRAERTTRRIFDAWLKLTKMSKMREHLLRRSANFCADRIVMTVKRAFGEWHELCERKKLAIIRADERFKRLKIRFIREYFNEWRQITTRDKWCRLAVMRFLKNSERHHKSAILIAWQREAIQSRIDREKRRRADRMMLELTNKKLYAAFFSWRDAVDRRRELDAKVRRSVAKLSSRLMFAAFFGWKSATDEAREDKMRGKKAIAWCLTTTQRRAFVRWVEATREQKRLKRLVAKFLDRRNGTLLRIAFQSWHEVLHRKYELTVSLEKTLRGWRQRRLRHAFTVWSQAVEQAKYVRMQANRMREKIQRNSSAALLMLTFWEWCQIAQDARHERLIEESNKEILRQRYELFVRMKATRAMRRAFVTWYEFVAVQMDRRAKLTWCLNRMASRIVFSAFNAWVQEVADRKRQREVMNAALMRASNQLMFRSFNAWRDAAAKSVDAQIHLRRMEVIVNLQAKNAAKERVKRAFGAWKEHSRANQRQREVVAKAVATMKNREQAKAFACWREAAKLLAEQRRALVRVAQKMQRNNLRLAFDTWMDNANEAKACRDILRRATQKISKCKVYHAFYGWRWRTQEKKRQSALLNRAISKFSGRRLHVAFYEWANTVALMRHQRQVVERVTARMKNSLLASAFEQWKQRASEQRIERWKMDRALARLTQRVLFTAFNTWFDYVRTRKRYQAVVDRFYEKFRDRSLRGTFTTWVTVTREAKEHRLAVLRGEQLRANKLAQILGSVRRQTAGYVFMEWRDRVQEIKRMRVSEMKASRAIVRINLRALSHAFDSWISFVNERRRKVEIARVFILRAKRRELAAAFDGWLDVAKTRKRNRMLVEKSLRRMRNRLTASVFYTWLEHVELARAERSHERRVANVVQSSLAKIQRRTLNMAFNGWHFRTTERKRHLMLVTKSLQRMRNRTLSEAFSGWQARVLMLRRQKELVNMSLQRMRRRLLFKALSSWSEYVKKLTSFRVVERRLQNVERAIAPLHVTHSTVTDMVRVNMAMRWGLARNVRIYRNPTFVAWAQYSQRMSAHRNRTVTKMHDILADRARRKFFFAWKQLVEVMKYRRLKVLHGEKKVVRRIFTEWKLNTRAPLEIRGSLEVSKFERSAPSTGWDFNKSYEENVQLLVAGNRSEAYGSRYSTPIGSPVTIRPTIIEPDSYEKRYLAVMSDVHTMEAEVEALSQVRESLQGQFDLLARDEAVRATYARAASVSTTLLRETKTYYSDRRFSEPFSPVKTGAPRL